jgi:hypothetical protein
LSIQDYETINNSAEAIYEHFKRFHKRLNFKYMELLLERWLDNNCSLYDLDVLRSKLDGLDEGQLYEVLNSRSGYINLVYGNKISNIPLAIIPRYKEDVLIYAITQKKNGFIRLIEENQDSFNCVGSESILFNRAFFAQHFNLNSLSTKDLRDCVTMTVKKILFDELERGRIYTFNEIKALYDLPAPYYIAVQLKKIQRRNTSRRPIESSENHSRDDAKNVSYWPKHALSDYSLANKAVEKGALPCKLPHMPSSVFYYEIVRYP